MPHVARHMDVNAIPDDFSEDAQGLDFIEAFVEIRTTWQPIGV